LEKWGLENPKVALVRAFPLPVGAGLGRWIQERTQANDGAITLQAANQLAELVGAEPRMLEQEILKLLAYVNYARPVEVDDVQHLTPKTARAADFALVNALRNRDGRQALQGCAASWKMKSPSIIPAVVTQFRQLLQVREILEKGREDVLPAS
jgi:DNA polymerase III delta subunit